METRQASSVAISAEQEKKYLTGDVTIFWTRKELAEYIHCMQNREIPVAKIRRQAPKQARVKHVNKQVYTNKLGKENNE